MHFGPKQLMVILWSWAPSQVTYFLLSLPHSPLLLPFNHPCRVVNGIDLNIGPTCLASSANNHEQDVLQSFQWMFIANEDNVDDYVHHHIMQNFNVESMCILIWTHNTYTIYTCLAWCTTRKYFELHITTLPYWKHANLVLKFVALYTNPP